MTRRIIGILSALMIIVVLLLAAIVTAKNANTTARQRDYTHAIAYAAATLCTTVCGVHLLKRHLFDSAPDPTPAFADAPSNVIPFASRKTHPDWLSPQNRRHLAQT
jgi:hypothetical protein